MKKEKEQDNQVQDSSIITNNEMLLSLEGWLKYIEGFTKGISSSEKVSSTLVMECITEVLEYMAKFKIQLKPLLLYCEKVMKDNEQLKEELNLLKNTPLIEMKEDEDGLQ